jgi:hypothetical protein
MSYVDPELEDKLESSEKWEKISDDQDMVGLVKLIRGISHQHDEVKQGTISFVKHDLALYLNYQKSHEDVGTFFKLCDVIDTFGGKAGFHYGLYMQHRKAIAATKPVTPPATEFPLSGLTDEENKQALASSCKEYKAALFLIIPTRVNTVP